MWTVLTWGWVVFATILVLLRLHDIMALQEATMAQIDDVAAANDAKTDVLIAKQNETIVTLQELKALVDGATPTNAIAVLEATGAKLDAALANLTAAEDAADPTPDA